MKRFLHFLKVLDCFFRQSLQSTALVGSFNLSLVYAANIHYKNNVFGLDVVGNGNVPKYSFYLVGNDTRYDVSFDQFFEASLVDGALKKNGQSNIALASLTWEWSDIINDENGDLHFTITALNAGHGNTKQFSSLTFNNHIKNGTTLNPDNTTLSGALLKFDVLINDYKWVSTEEDAKVVLVYSFTSPGLQAEKKDGRIQLGDAYFNSATTASSFDDPKSATDITVTTDFSGNAIWLVYDHWTSAHLVHDPELGFGEEANNNQTLIIVLSVIGSVLVVGIVVGLFVYRQRLRYQSI